MDRDKKHYWRERWRFYWSDDNDRSDWWIWPALILFVLLLSGGWAWIGLP